MEEKSRRAKAFWDKAARWAELRVEDTKPNVVSFRHHLFPCFQHSKEALLFLHRNSKQETLSLEIMVEESSGGAKSGRDFICGVHQVHNLSTLV